MKEVKEKGDLFWITFNEKEYPARSIDVEDFGEVTIASLKLDEELFDKDGNYVSREALRVDEGIFFYVDEELLKEMSDSALSAYVQESL